MLAFFDNSAVMAFFRLPNCPLVYREPRTLVDQPLTAAPVTGCEGGGLRGSRATAPLKPI